MAHLRSAADPLFRAVGRLGRASPPNRSRPPPADATIHSAACPARFRPSPGRARRCGTALRAAREDLADVARLPRSLPRPARPRAVTNRLSFRSSSSVSPEVSHFSTRSAKNRRCVESPRASADLGSPYPRACLSNPTSTEPPAFTPTCSVNHLPPYHEKFDELKSKGVDAVYCLASKYVRQPRSTARSRADPAPSQATSSSCPPGAASSRPRTRSP